MAGSELAMRRAGLEETGDTWMERGTMSPMWTPLESRSWDFDTPAVRWALSWRPLSQWVLMAYRTRSSWSALAFDAHYQPNAAFHDAPMDEEQGKRWADAMIAAMLAQWGEGEP